jgi:hypothetical protein
MLNISHSPSLSPPGRLYSRPTTISNSKIIELGDCLLEIRKSLIRSFIARDQRVVIPDKSATLHHRSGFQNHSRLAQDINVRICARVTRQLSGSLMYMRWMAARVGNDVIRAFTLMYYKRRSGSERKITTLFERGFNVDSVTISLTVNCKA